MTKRLFDLVVASIGMALLAPLLAVIGILVRRGSDGPAVFSQERVGMGGKPFMLFKFRSMEVGQEPGGRQITGADDPRITRLGAVLRSTKLDELPQLVNVVRGDMSIVGPRPEVPRYAALWSEEERRVILSVRPGMTDPATLHLRHEERLLAAQPDPESFYVRELLPLKTRIYCEYVKSRTLGGDLALIGRTIWIVIRG